MQQRVMYVIWQYSIYSNKDYIYDRMAKGMQVDLMVGDRKEMGGMRQDDRGITLVEIIIAIAASVIVISAATLFIRNALRSYGLATDAVDLQIEAQVLMEQLATWVMEGNYVLYEDSDGDEVNDVFIVYHIPRETLADSGERWMRVFWCDESKKIMYMYKQPKDEDFEDPTGSGSNLDLQDYAKIKADGENRHLFSNYVESFAVEIKNGSNGLPNKVIVTLVMKAGIEYRDEINIRNASYVPPTESPQPTGTPP